MSWGGVELEWVGLGGIKCGVGGRENRGCDGRWADGEALRAVHLEGRRTTSGGAGPCKLNRCGGFSFGVSSRNGYGLVATFVFVLSGGRAGERCRG